MTIKGLNDDIIPRFPRYAKLRKGGEKTANGYGPDLDHFRFVAADPEIAKAFYGVYPARPSKIDLLIPHDTVEDAFQTSCEIWNKTGLVHRCDGQTMSVWREGDHYERGAKPCPGGHKDSDPHQDAVGRLEFVIPQLLEQGHVGYVTLETHSIHDILNIGRVLSAVYKAAGTLAGVEFVMSRVKENISVPGWGDRKGERARVDKWLVRLEPSVTWVRAMFGHTSRTALERLNAVMVEPAAGAVLNSPESRPALPEPTSAPIAPTAESTPATTLPASAPAPASPTGGNAKPSGKAKTASIKVTFKVWNEFCDTFAERFPPYRNEEGKPDKFHIGASSVACGFNEVTGDNFEQVKTALIQRALAKAQPEPA